MRISDINLVTVDGRRRAEATILWEEADRPPFLWYVETEARHEGAFWPNPNGWLLGAVLPAWHAGERRVRVDGTLCPVLLGNLRIALGVLGNWFPEMGPPPEVEATDGLRAYYPHRAEAACLLSCGVDSLATLRWNRLNLPPDHPRSISGALYVEFLGGPFVEQSLSEEILLRRKFVQRVADSIGIDALRVTTNLWELDGDGWFYSYKWHGAFLSSMAHFFSQRFNKTYLASSAYASGVPRPWGSHPLLDPRYSGGDMEIEHDGLHMTRYDKTALVGDWPAGLSNLLVCLGQPRNGMNCGACEKCIETMSTLVALGKLSEAETFPVTDVTPELLATVIDYDMIDRMTSVEWWESLIPALAERGRDDLVAVIRRFRPYLLGKQSADERLTSAISRAIPGDRRFVVADNKHFLGDVGERSRGRRWGLPRDTATAIRELEHLRESGVSYLALTPETIWWPDHFKELRDYLGEAQDVLYAEGESLIYSLPDSRTPCEVA